MIRGRNLTLMSGAGDIGASNKFLEMMVNGWLMANSGNSIYVHQNGNMPLTLLSAAAGMDAYLRADNGIRMYNGYGMDMGYINAGRTVDLYTKHGDIDDVRILAFHHPKCVGIELNSKFETAPAVKDVEKIQ